MWPFNRAQQVRLVMEYPPVEPSPGAQSDTKSIAEIDGALTAQSEKPERRWDLIDQLLDDRSEASS